MSQHLISVNIKFFATSVDAAVASAGELEKEASSRCARAEAQYVAARSASPGIARAKIGRTRNAGRGCGNVVQGSFDRHRCAPVPQILRE